jgi:hypothetical protein
MNRRSWLRLLVASGAAIGLPALAAAPTAIANPRDIVVEIYRISAGKDGNYRGPSAFSDKGVRSRYFSKSLLAAIVRMEKLSKQKNEPILDFDPVTNSQDPDVKDLQIAVESETPSNVVVAARFLSFEEKEPSIVRYDFIKDGGAWKIDDIHGEHGKDKWSLRDTIK